MPVFTVALTGGIASGKSTVCRLLEEKGACVIDSDTLAREVVRHGTPAWSEIVEHFGDGILLPDGEIDRGKLGEIVFNQPSERAFLNQVTHPRIFQLMMDRLKEFDEETRGKGIAVLDIPLLVEANAGGMFDFVLVVDSSPEVQERRLLEDRGSTREDARARIRSQVPREERLKHADHVIPNEGSLEDLRREVDEAWQVILKRSQRVGS